MSQKETCVKCNSEKRTVLENANETGKYVCVNCDSPRGFCPVCGYKLRTDRAEQCISCHSSWRKPISEPPVLSAETQSILEVIKLLYVKSSRLLRNAPRNDDSYRNVLEEYITLYKKTKLLLREFFKSNIMVISKINILPEIELKKIHFLPYWIGLLFPPIIFFFIVGGIIYRNSINSKLRLIIGFLTALEGYLKKT